MRNYFLLFLIFCQGCDKSSPDVLVGHLNKTGLPALVRTSCPSGYIEVPGLAPFCIGKYEAQIINNKAVSAINGQPASVSSRDQAVAACAALGASYKLIDNTHWQRIARDVENVATNWSGGRVGDGSLSQGHSDSFPNQPLAPGPDKNGCLGITNSDCTIDGWHFQKRTFLLSNREVIWDLAGNQSEWISDDPSIDRSFAENGVNASDLTEKNLIATWGSSILNKTLLDRANFGGLGFIHASLAIDTNPVGIVRGGGFNSDIDSGVFATELNVPTNAATVNGSVQSIGFRCVFTPAKKN